MEYIYSDTGIPRVVTARERVILGDSFMSYSKSVREHHHLHGHVSHERYTVYSEGQDANLQILTPVGVEPRAADLVGQHSTC